MAESIPCTTVARTLLDLAAVVREESLRAAFRKAEILRVLDVREVEAAAGRVSRPRGVVALRRVIADFDPELLYTESAMEGRFLELCRTSGLPVPEASVPLVVGNESFRPDFLWRRERLIIELDSSRFHSTPSGVERDKRRDQALLLAGWTTVRVTESQLRDEPILLANKTAQLLAQRRVDGDPEQRSSGRKP